MGVGVGMPAGIRLDLFGARIFDAYGQYPYLVGSAATSKTWRDVDVRLMLADNVFDLMFPNYQRWNQHDPAWGLICDALSELAKQMTGLPVDFQIQRTSDANARYHGVRNALGLRPFPELE